MRAHDRFLLPYPLVNRFAGRVLGISGIVLAICLAWSAAANAADETDTSPAQSIDSRWLPWIGSWRLIPDAVREEDSAAKKDYVVEINPGDDGKTVMMKSYEGEKLLLESRITADGSRQPLKDEKCGGWYRYSWSESGKRLLFESQSSCPGELARFVYGLSIVTDNRDWLDIQLLRSGEDRAVSVRKFRSVAESTKAMPAPRYLAATSLSIDEVIDLSRRIPYELIEAAIVELDKPFKINSSALKRLADAHVQPQVVDLMVAISFPDRFDVSRQRVVPVRQRSAGSSGGYYGPSYGWLPFGYWSIYGPYSSWYWGSPFYDYWGWNVWRDGYSYGGHGGGREDRGGRLINGRGYSRVEPARPDSQPRYAHPRNEPGYTGSGASGGTAVSSPPPAAVQSGSSAPAPSGSSGSSSPSASPSGYHSGNSGGGASAKPRD